MVMQWPPQVPSANHIRTQSRILVGPPLASIASLNYQEGNPIQTGVSTVTDDILHEFDNVIVVTSNVSFSSSGALCIVGATGDNWFSYTGVTGLDTFTGLKRLSGGDTYIEAGAAVTQLRDITELVERYEIKLMTEESSFYWKATLSGFLWDSSKIVQDNSVIIQERYWNDLTDIVGTGTPRTYTESVTDDPRDALPWTDWTNRYRGYFDEPSIEGSGDGSKWVCSATGQSKYLRFQQTPARQYGVEKLNVTWTASTTLQDAGAEPTESQFGGNFSAPNVGDGSTKTRWVSSVVPTKTNLAARPTGPWGVNSWVKIQMLAIANPESNEVSAQRSMLIELYNAYEFNTADEGEGKASYHNVILENNYGQRLYLWSQNGYSTGEQYFSAESSLAIFYDQEVGTKIYHIGDGVTPTEIQHVDGFKPGLNPYVTHRSIGREFRLDRKSGWLAVRLARTGRGSGVQTTSIDAVQATVVSDAAGIVTVDSTTGFPAFGMIEANDRIVNYTSKDSTNFYGCTTVAGADTAYGVGNTVFLHTFTEFYTDFVSWGNGVDSEGETIMEEPTEFWIQGFNNDIVTDQNASTFSDQVWTSAYRVASTGSGHAFEDGIPVGGCIRRVNAMGGGVAVTGDYPLGGVSNADKHSYEDWQVYTVPRLGNTFSLGTYQWLKGEVAEHTAAIVVTDAISDWTDDPDDSTLTVQPGQALPYPRTLVEEERIKVNRAMPDGTGFWTFRYTEHDGTTFKGVRFVHPATLENIATPGSPALQAGDTLTKIINVAPPGHPARYEPFNIPELQSTAIRRYKDGVVMYFATDSVTTVTLYGPGGASIPTSGTLYGNYIDLKYTGASYDAATQTTTLTGVTRNPVGSQPTTGDAFEFQSGLSVPTEMYLRISAMQAPMDPLAFLPEGDAWTYQANNPDWNDVWRTSNNRSPSILINPEITAPRRYAKWLFVLIGEQLNLDTLDNERAKINEIEVFGTTPLSTTESDDYGIMVYQEPYERVYKLSSIAKQILFNLGVSEQRMIENFGGGPTVRNISVGKGGGWRACAQLAKQGQCIFGEGTGGDFNFFPDPRLPGGFGKDRSELVFDASTILAPPTIKDKPRGSTGQILLNATNNRANESYQVYHPPTPAGNGETTTKPNYIVDGMLQAQMLAAYLYRMENQGWAYELKFGQWYKLKPFQIVRVRTITTDDGTAIFDSRLVEFNRDFVTTGISYVTTWEGTDSTFSGDELICP